MHARNGRVVPPMCPPGLPPPGADPVGPGRAARELTNLGFATHGLGDLARAHELYRRGLAAAEELGLVESELHALLGIAAYEAEAGDTVAAARLFGRMKELQSHLGAASAWHDMGLEERMLASLRDALGPEQLASELATGAAMSHQQAIDLALGRIDPAAPRRALPASN